MAILNKEEIEKYSSMRISEMDLSEIFGGNLVKKLKDAEEEIVKIEEYGLPYYLAFQYHIKRKSIRGVADNLNRILEQSNKGLSISSGSIDKLLKYLDIPMRTVNEFKDDTCLIIEKEYKTFLS